MTASIGNDEPLRHAREGQPDLEAALGHGKIPVLMLQDDRHVLRVFLAQTVRHSYPGEVGAERDVEVMVAGKAVLRRVAEDLAHDPFERVLHQEVVADQVFGHPGA